MDIAAQVGERLTVEVKCIQMVLEKMRWVPITEMSPYMVSANFDLEYSKQKLHELKFHKPTQPARRPRETKGKLLIWSFHEREEIHVRMSLAGTWAAV